MMLYLLFLVLFLGTASCLAEEDGTPTPTRAGAEMKNSSAAGPTHAVNLTRHLVDELGNNQTFIAEDDEAFQDQDHEFPDRRCQEGALEEFSHSYCGERFHTEMEAVRLEDWCTLTEVIRPYNEMMLCVEELSSLVGCYYPNPVVQAFFLSIHSDYFHNCSQEEQLLPDAPQQLVVALTLVPVSIIPFLVYLVVCKSGVKE
ncbi:Receptor activity-modifying protein 3 [Liparis tanakae]|uniref:Receptor activity-modifying protein 3 n=1 Tax=Liparis tanakae TaxID=230148 RepID=A0A4Z2GM02_9TELE|nr:Receptor activity-modifying protein 3 [Liparis tanakae]